MELGGIQDLLVRVVGRHGQLVDTDEFIVGVHGYVAGGTDAVKVHPPGSDHGGHGPLQLSQLQHGHGIFDGVHVVGADSVHHGLHGAARADIAVLFSGGRLDNVDGQIPGEGLVSIVAGAFAQPDHGGDAGIAGIGQLGDGHIDHFGGEFDDELRQYLFLGSKGI